MSTLLTASVLLCLLWPAYVILLRYSDRYVLNRFLLVLAMVAVCALPFLSLESPAPAITQSLQGTIEYVEETAYPSLAPVPEDRTVHISNIEVVPSSPVEHATARIETIPLVYGLGVLLLTLLLVGRLLFLLSLHLRSRLSSNGQYRLLREGATSGQAFTFGNTLYFSANVVNGPDFDHVLAHERVHARQGHSLDVFLSEVFLCIFWFHPAAWWLRAKMRANLEFLVDKAVLSAGADRRDYQLALVRQSQATHGLALTLPFSEPSLKSRIVRMMGMPEYRVVGIIATVALLFWLGVAAMVVKGTPVEEVGFPTSQFEDGALNSADEPHSATEFLYATHFAQPIPEKINSFELYFRRLPTPDEYLQIKSILQRIPHTNFNIYEPCNGTPGTYLMQLSHYLKQEAVFRSPLREGEILPYHFQFSLKKRTSSQPIPDDLPLDSYGYYEPAIYISVSDISETDNGLEFFDGVNTYPVTTDRLTVGKQYFTGTQASKIPQEPLVVFINGERFNLLPKADVKFEDGMQFAGYGHTKEQIWYGIEGEENDPNALPNSLGQMPSWTVMPPNARMACLLGMEEDPTGMVREVSSQEGRISEGYLVGSNYGATLAHQGIDENLTKYIKGMTYHLRKIPTSVANYEGRTKYYLNDEPISFEELLATDFPVKTLIQSGWNSNVKNGPLVFQVITDAGRR